MTLDLSLPQDPFDIRPKITVIGVGGRQCRQQHDPVQAGRRRVLIANTDAQALQQSMCERRIQLGSTVTKAWAPAPPTSAAPSAEEAIEIMPISLPARTWPSSPPAWAAAPARGGARHRADRPRQGILTVGVVTKPFHFEGAPPHATGGKRASGTAAIRRYADHHPEPEPVPHRQREDHLRRRLQDGRRGAAIPACAASPT